MESLWRFKYTIVRHEPHANYEVYIDLYQSPSFVFQYIRKSGLEYKKMRTSTVISFKKMCDWSKVLSIVKLHTCFFDVSC